MADQCGSNTICYPGTIPIRRVARRDSQRKTYVYQGTTTENDMCVPWWINYTSKIILPDLLFVNWDSAPINYVDKFVWIYNGQPLSNTWASLCGFISVIMWQSALSATIMTVPRTMLFRSLQRPLLSRFVHGSILLLQFPEVL
jgi:hypothetical protein